MWRSLVARTVRDGEVVRSNRITPTIQEMAHTKRVPILFGKNFLDDWQLHESPNEYEYQTACECVDPEVTAELY